MMARNTGAIIKRHNILTRILTFTVFATSVWDLNFENPRLCAPSLQKYTHEAAHNLAGGPGDLPGVTDRHGLGTRGTIAGGRLAPGNGRTPRSPGRARTPRRPRGRTRTRTWRTTPGTPSTPPWGPGCRSGPRLRLGRSRLPRHPS